MKVLQVDVGRSLRNYSCCIQHTVYSISHTPLGRFSMVDYLHSWNSVRAKKSVLGTSHLELIENVVSFGIGTPLVAEQTSFENRLRGV